MQYYSCIAVLFLAFVTICYSTIPINHICVSPNNDNAYCTPVPTDLIQHLSLRTHHTCGAESQKVCWISANTNEVECQTCDNSDNSTAYPLSNLMDNSSYWISDGSSEAVIYLEGYKSNILSQIRISFLSSLPTGTIIESLTSTSTSYSTVAYLTDNCSVAPANLQSLCIQHSSTDALEYISVAGLESNAIRVTFESQMKNSGNQFYSHAIEGIIVSGACDCNGHASECSGSGSDRYCECQHNTSGRDCTSCTQGYYPSGSRDVSDPNYCEVGCDCELCGVEDEFQPCDPVTKECTCKDNVEGDRCDRCKSGFHSLTFSNPAGCEECECDYAGAEDLPCNATTKGCVCRVGFVGPTCDVGRGLYVPLLEEIFSIINIASNLDTPTYVLLDAGVTSGRGWRVSSVDPFYTQFRVGESGDYLFFPLITASSPDIMVVFTLSDNSDSVTYTIPATNLSRWNVVLSLNSEFMYTITVELSSKGLLVVEELLFLPLGSTSISYDRLALESLYSRCVPYQFQNSLECTLSKELSISITQSPLDCDCYINGSVTSYCESYGGQCKCIPGYGGRRCDECAPGLQMRPDGICGPCNCDPVKSETAACNSTGYCYCIDRVSIEETDKTCSRCRPGYILSSTGVCENCECNTAGSENQICDPISGECVCRDGYEGPRCDRCQPTHLYSGDECVLCPCPGTKGWNFADQCSYIEASVSCSCSEGFTGLQCEECDAGYFAEYTDTGVLSGCRRCECSGKGILVEGRICDSITGQCLSCADNTGGDSCEYCVDGFYQPVDVQESCQACECDVMGSLDNLCNRYTGICECREGFSGERCDQCAVNFFNSSNTCPACNNCFNQVFELYSSLRDRIDLYQYISQSGCTLLSPPLQDLLDSYSMNISLLRIDIVSVNQVDVVLYSALTELARQVEELNTEVLNLLNNANQEESQAEEIERTSEQNYQAARNTLSNIEDIYKFNVLKIQRLVYQLVILFTEMLSNINDVDIILSRENDLVESQRLWIAESSQLSTSIIVIVADTLSAARSVVQSQANTNLVISWSFSLLRVLQTQIEYLNSTYMQVEDAADTAEGYLNDILSMVDFSPFNFPEFPHDTLSNDVLTLEDFIEKLQEQVLTQVNRSNSEIDRSQVLVLRGKFLQNITNILLDRLNSHKQLAENAAQESNLLIQQITEKQNEISTIHTESVQLVELLDQLFSLLNETQQNLTIQSCEDTLVLIQTAIDNVTELSNQLVTVRNSVQRAIVDSRSANRTVSVMLIKVDLVEQSITEISDRTDEVVVLTEARSKHEDDGAAQLDETETFLESVTRYTNYFKTRVDLLELEFMKLNQSLVGIGVVSEEEIENILIKIGLLEAEALNNAERLEYTERDLLEAEKELEYLERAVYESYQQINEFDGLLDDIKQYNDQRGCA